MMLLSLTLAALVAVASPAWAADEPVEIVWPDLMPQRAEPVMPDDLNFGDDTLGDDQAPVDQTYDPDLGGLVQHGMTPAAPGVVDPTDVVTKYNDVQVRIAGYVLPLDFEETTVKEFLLVPYVGACIHVPPPPPNPDHLRHQRGRHRGHRHVRAGLGNRNAADGVAFQRACRCRLHDEPRHD